MGVTMRIGAKEGRIYPWPGRFFVWGHQTKIKGKQSTLIKTLWTTGIAVFV
jgi:hypothetical protein